MVSQQSSCSATKAVQELHCCLYLHMQMQEKVLMQPLQSVIF